MSDKMSDSDRKVNRNIYPDAVTHDGMRLLDLQSGQLGPIRHWLLEEFLGKKNSINLHKAGF